MIYKILSVLFGLLILASCTKTAPVIVVEQKITSGFEIRVFRDTVNAENYLWECPDVVRWESDTTISYYRRDEPEISKEPHRISIVPYGKLFIRTYFIYIKKHELTIL